jgi:FkbM family methyltransferase
MRAVMVNEFISIVHGKDGYFLVNRNDFYVGKALEIYGEYGGIESAFLKSVITPGTTVVEVGANIGSHTVGLAKAVGPQGKVFVFEPQRACYALLQAQIALNQFGNIYAFNQGVGRTRGKLWVPRINYAQRGNFGGVALSNDKTAGAETVDVVTLDESVSDISCALIKIDVEGMEEEVIRGAVSLIKNQHPLLYVENDRVEKSSSLVSLLLDLGYRLWWHIPQLYNPNNFFGVKENIYGNVVSFNMFCCQGNHTSAVGLVEIKSPNDPHPLTGIARPQQRQSATVALEAKFSQARAYSQQGKPADAERICEEILAHDPKHVDALHLLGEIALRARRIEAAIELFGKAIALKPDFVEAYCDRGMALRKLKRPEDALASYDQAIALKPDFAMAHNNRGNVLLDLSRPEEALASCDQAIALSPNLAIAYYNRARALQDVKRFEDALADYDQATALRPDFAEAIWNKSLCLLLLGRFDQGFPLYEWRKRRDEPVATRSYPQPLWLGEEGIAGKTLFIWWEQGFGDTIQFCRYAKLAKARGAKVIMSVQRSLLKLLIQISPSIEIIDPEEVPNNFDYHCPLLSLPLAFRTTLATIPTEQQYLKADENLRLAWAARLPPKTKPRIGLVWSGRMEHKNDHNRSIELEQLSSIINLDADWTCLQKEIKDKDLVVLQQLGRIRCFGDELRDFSDTAALLELMDVVITVDTSVAHLAGAMGKPVWMMLPYSPDWRWLLDRNDSPWYPSARLFRQRQIRNWAGVIDQVKNELRSLIG